MTQKELRFPPKRFVALLLLHIIFWIQFSGFRVVFLPIEPSALHIDQLCINNFFCTVTDVIATLHPFHLSDTLQVLGHTLGSFHLLHDNIWPVPIRSNRQDMSKVLLSE